MPQIQSAEPMHHHRRRRDIDDFAPRPAPDDPPGRRVKALGVFAVMVGTLQVSRAIADRRLSDDSSSRAFQNALELLGADDQGDRCTPSWPKHDGTADQAFVEHKDKSARPGRRERARLPVSRSQPVHASRRLTWLASQTGNQAQIPSALLDAMVTAISGPRSARPGSRFGWVAVHRKPTGLLPEAPRFGGCFPMPLPR